MKTKLLSFVALFSLLATTAMAQDAWYPYPVEVWDQPFNMESSRTNAEYVPLETASKKWHIHVFFPHMKDAYWLAVNYGIADEARRLGIKMTLKHAGGYENLDRQIAQIRQVLKTEPKPDGIVLGAISYTGLDSIISEIRAHNIPVIDVINGISSSEISAKSLVFYGDMGRLAGEYLVKNHSKDGEPVKVAWFPGPEGAGWVQAADAGFKDALKHGAIEVVSTRHGDTGKATQRKLIEETLDKHNDLNYIVGTTVTAEAAPSILRKRKLKDQIKVFSFYLSPGVFQGIRRGQIVGAPVDPAVIQGRIAVDQVVRILEGKDYFKHVGPQLEVLDAKSLRRFNKSSSLAPSGFRATYTVN